MSVPKGKNNFASHQTEVVDKNVKLIEAELKDIRGRAGVNFEDIDSLVRYISKVTGIHRTTLKRNTTYRRVLRDFLGRQQGSTSLVKIDDASPELLRAIVEERDMTIGNLINQSRILNERINRLEQTRVPAPEPVKTLSTFEVAMVGAASAEAAFQDTAFALVQLIKHINRTVGGDSIVIDEEKCLIMDMAIPNPKKRMDMAIGPERVKAFAGWYKANKWVL